MKYLYENVGVLGAEMVVIVIFGCVRGSWYQNNKNISYIVNQLNFCIYIKYQIRNKKMRLRHKKPLNSYVGQGNYDSNQVQDEDFAKNPIQKQKTKLIKHKPINDQTRKYAQILCEFVSVVNQDYRKHCARFPQNEGGIGEGQWQKGKIQLVPEPRNQREPGGVRGQEVVSKQQQKIRNREIILNRQLSSNKRESRNRLQLHKLTKNQQPPEIQPKPQIIPPPQKNIPNNSIKQPINIQNDKTPPPPTPAQTNLASQVPNITSIEQLQQIQLQQQQLLQNQLFAMNSGMFPMFNFMPNMINYQLYLEQMKGNPYAAMQLQRMMGVFPQNNQSNYIPFSKLPFSKNTQPDKKQDSQTMKNQGGPGGFSHNLHPQQQVKPTVQTQPPSPHPNPQQPQQQPQVQVPTQLGQKVQPTPQKQNEKKQEVQPIDFKRKSCYHVAIAYNIHFARLKEKGLLNGCVNGEQNYMKLDPTFPAKRVRQRRNSEITKKNIGVNDQS